jgi:hypothetical protein
MHQLYVARLSILLAPFADPLAGVGYRSAVGLPSVLKRCLFENSIEFGDNCKFRKQLRKPK